MGQKDLTQKQMEAYADVFADLINALLYGGQPVVLAQELKPAPTESVYDTGAKKLKNQFADISYYIVRDGRIQMQYIMENQTIPERRHVLRKAGYIGAAYRKQYDAQEMYPVVQIVLYWGKRSWKTAGGLKALLSHNPFAKLTERYIDEISLHVYEMNHLSKEIREHLKSDMRIVADYLAEGSAYQPTDQKIVHLEAFLQMMYALTGDARYEEMITEFEGKEKIGMCELLDRYENRGIQKGIQKGEFRWRILEYIDIRREDRYAEEEICQGIMRKFGLTEEKANCYMRGTIPE